MKGIKYELQNLINGNGQVGTTSQLKKTQNFLRGHAQTGAGFEKQKYIKSKEEKLLIDFASKSGLFFPKNISEDMFISEGAEQRVYRYDDHSVIKLNSSVFYEYWHDYFNSLLIHNFFFKSTAYQFLGFKMTNGRLAAVVKQDFIVATEPTDIETLKYFLSYNSFTNIRNNDYASVELGIIFEDLHDENVLSRDGLLYFIDTIFYLTKDFFN